MSEQMNCERVDRPEGRTLIVTGEIDLATVDTLNEHLDAIAGAFSGVRRPLRRDVHQRVPGCSSCSVSRKCSISVPPDRAIGRR